MSKEVSILKIDEILPNRFQPRIVFDENAINELTESIKEYGVIEPIIVRKVADKYEIIAGERRYKASVLAGKETIPAIITDLNDKDSAEIALIENVQRQNLTPIEEAVSYKKILDMGYMNQSELAEKLGKKQSTVANKLRLLNLTDTVQEALLEEKISERHARSLLKLPKNKQDDMLNKIIQERMTVRKTDEEINKVLSGSSTEEPKKEEKEEQTMNNNDFMNQFNIPSAPIIGEEPAAPAMPEMPTVAPVSPVAPIEPIAAAPVAPVAEPVVPAMPEIPAVAPVSPVAPIEPIAAAPVAPVAEPVAPAMPEIPAVAPVSPVAPIEPITPAPVAPIVEPVAEQPNPMEAPTVQTIDNEPATAENSDTPITGRFFNMFGSEEEEETGTETQEKASDFNPFGNIEQPAAPAMPEMPAVAPVNPVSPIEPIAAAPVAPVVEPVAPVMPEMPTVAPVSPVAPMEPIPMPTIPVAPQMQQPTQSEVNPLQDGQLNSNQEFTNSSVVELGTLQNRRMEEPTLQPLMEQQEQGPKVDMKEIINMIRNCASEIEKAGYTIDTDELDFDDSYQVIFKIDKID